MPATSSSLPDSYKNSHNPADFVLKLNWQNGALNKLICLTLSVCMIYDCCVKKKKKKITLSSKQSGSDPEKTYNSA